MEPPTENPARAHKPETLPREQLARSVFQMPATWVCAALILLLLGAIGRMFWRMQVGWREDAVPRVERLYSFLRSGRLLKDAPSEWFTYNVTTAQSSTMPIGPGDFDTTYGHVISFSVVDHFEGPENEETVRLSVTRDKVGTAQEDIEVDRSGRIVNIERR